jgi:hypothetical protein
VLSVDGREVARNSIEHGTPITFPETRPSTSPDTRTPLALIEYRYDVPFKFTGKINKVTFNLGDEKLSAEGRRWCTRPRPCARRTLTSAARDETCARSCRTCRSRDRRGAARCSVACRATVARRGPWRRRTASSEVAGIALIALGFAAGRSPRIGMLLYSAGVRCFSPMSASPRSRRSAMAGNTWFKRHMARTRFSNTRSCLHLDVRARANEAAYAHTVSIRRDESRECDHRSRCRHRREYSRPARQAAGGRARLDAA